MPLDKHLNAVRNAGLAAIVERFTGKSVSDFETSIFGKPLNEGILFSQKEGPKYRKQYHKALGFNTWKSLQESILAAGKEALQKSSASENNVVPAIPTDNDFTGESVQLDLFGETETTPEKRSNRNIAIYTDGACNPNPGHGAWAYVVVEDNTVIHQASGYRDQSTNNIEELSACIYALEYAEKMGFSHFILYSDSQYAVKGINTWIHNWRASDPSLSFRLNGHLWNRFEHLKKQTACTVEWVRGHSGNKYNELCDSLCNAEYDKRCLRHDYYAKYGH